MRIRDWYFQGWERQDDGDGKRRLVYTGEYYELSGAPRFKAVCAALSAALVLAYLLAALFPSAGGMWRIAAIPQLLELLPLIYLVMGTVRLLLAKPPLTYRDWHASWRRMFLSSAWSAGVTAVMTVVELVYLLLVAERPSLPRELTYLLVEAVCLTLSLALARFIKTHPCSQIADPSAKE